MWEPFSAKLKMMAEDFPAIISKAVESSTRKLQDDLFALRTENSIIRIEAEKLMEEAQAQAHMQAHQRVDLGQP